MGIAHDHGTPANVPPADGSESLTAIHRARTPRYVRRTAVGIVVMVFGMVPVLVAAPWTQTVHGTGRALAFNPVQRPQYIVSPIEGRVKKWYVVEGDRVRAGQLLVDLVDNDPYILERLREQEMLALQRLTLADGRVNDQEARLRFITDEREVLIAEAVARVLQADAQILVVRQELERAKSDLVREDLAYNRLDRLFRSKAGQVVPEDTVEEARRKFELARAMVPLVEARIELAERTLDAARAAKSAVEARTSAAINTESGAVKSAKSEQAAVRQQFNVIRTQVERQANQRVYAAATGTVFRILANAEAGGQLVKAGERLAVLVPDVTNIEDVSASKQVAFGGAAGGFGLAGLISLTSGEYPGIVAELSIDGNDLPLVRKGDRVVLQFEGWAAVQFAAYPEAAAGTFEGRVYLVDPTSDANGRFRILAEPAPGEDWPDEQYLRQGVRAQGWVLVKEVRLGYEMWRLLNGFPPAREVTPDDANRPLGPVGKK